jgi:ABC-type transporter Mla subunit MlaD
MTPKQITDAAERAETLQKNLHDAEEYVRRIGSWGPREHGKLHTLTVATQIRHQPHNVEQAVHQCAAFDAALAIVVREHFPELAREALAHMARAFHDALITQKDALKGVLAQVERAEAVAAAQANLDSDLNCTNCSTESSHA